MMPSPQTSSRGADVERLKEQRQVTFDIANNWITYHAKLLVLAQARRWFPAAERLDAIEVAPL